MCGSNHYPAARRRRPFSFFAIEPLSARERGERSRRLSNAVWIGFGIGIGTALVATSLEVTGRGWSETTRHGARVALYTPTFRSRMQARCVYVKLGDWNPDVPQTARILLKESDTRRSLIVAVEWASTLG